MSKITARLTLQEKEVCYVVTLVEKSKKKPGERMLARVLVCLFTRNTKTNHEIRITKHESRNTKKEVRTWWQLDPPLPLDFPFLRSSSDIESDSGSSLA